MTSYPVRYRTKWYGIYVEQDGDNWFICDDSGCMEYYGKRHPTDKEIEQYASQTEYYSAS